MATLGLCRRKGPWKRGSSQIPAISQLGFYGSIVLKIRLSCLECFAVIERPISLYIKSQYAKYP